ncbi:MAG: ABC transporter ATP-binding protein, partial [Spirochaetales bacterium]|nr:ABC transporter ATP-binding protein [Spirochaetales bacterium]
MVGVINPDWSGAIEALVKYGVVVGISVIFSYLQAYIMVGVSQGSIFKIRNRMFNHMEKLPLSYFDSNAHGSLMSRFSNDTDTLNQLISNGLIHLIQALLTIIVVFLALVRNSWQLTLVVFAFIGITLFSTGTVAKKSSKYFINQQRSLGDVNGFIEEMINGQRVVKVFNYEEKSKKDFDVLNEKLRVAMTQANSWAGSMGPISNNIGNLQYVVLVLVGASLAVGSSGVYTIGALAAFLQLSKSFSNNIGQIANQMNSLLVALAGAERIYELEDVEVEENNGTVTLVNLDKDGNECSEKTGSWGWKITRDIVLNDAFSVKRDIDPELFSEPESVDESEWRVDASGKEYRYVPLKGEVIMKDVDFGYVPDKTVLHDISLYATPGQKIAFVGSTGAGKTTITNLLNRFYNIKDGAITFDGVNIKDIKLEDLRHSLGMILQETNLFTGTIKDNIKYGKLDATDEEVERAAKLANAHDFIMMMPEGYDTVIENNGEGLSQGQRQLLSIARAAIADPPVLVMDEATSSIDTHTEALVQSGMDKLMEGRTVFVIAHRLSTVRNSDAIMVLEKGRIIERGTHDSLIEDKGVYYNLYTGAFELS